MEATKHPHSPAGAAATCRDEPTSRDGAVLREAERLYELLAGGAHGLGYNVQGTPSLTEVVDGRRRVVAGVPQLEAKEDTVGPRRWRPARTLRAGREEPRRFNPWVLSQHLLGRYSVAPEAAGWVQWAALDIDAHPANPEDLAAVAAARARATTMLGQVWRAFGFGAHRQPLVLRSPGGGFHVWIPLTRGPSSTNPEHTWPAAWVRAWIALHLREAGLELRDGALELYPAGRRLRAPCGARMQFLTPERPDDPDDLGLVPWLGTVTARGRDVVAMSRAFCDAWEARRMTLAELLGRPEASWDRQWAFFAWRPGEDPPPAAVERFAKKITAVRGGDRSRSQEIDEVPGPRGGWGSGRRRRAAHGAGDREAGVGGSVPITDLDSTTPAPEDPDLPPEPAGALTRGPAFRRKVTRLLAEGLTEPSVRHDAVLTLTFFFGATCGLARSAVLDRIEQWCRALAHEGSRTLAEEGMAAFVRTCVGEAASYYDGHAARWPFRGRGGVPCAPLAAADQGAIAAVDARVRPEAAAVLSWFAGNADGAGWVREPVELAHGLLRALCADRRVVEDGRRRRAVVMAIEELIRIGVLTEHTGYAVGRHGRIFSCWYQFGSGTLPAPLATPEAALVGAADPDLEAAGGEGVAGGGTRPSPSAAETSLASSPPLILASRTVPEGTLRVLGDGTRAPPRVVLEPGPDVPAPATPGARPAWWMRLYARWFTVGEFLAGDPTVVPLPGRRRPRRVHPWMREPAREVDGVFAGPPPATDLPTSSGAPRAPTAADGGEALTLAVPPGLVEALPRDVALAVGGAWRAFERRSRET